MGGAFHLLRCRALVFDLATSGNRIHPFPILIIPFPLRVSDTYRFYSVSLSHARRVYLSMETALGVNESTLLVKSVFMR